MEDLNMNNYKSVTIAHYVDAYAFKRTILEDNNNKTGVYKWTNRKFQNSYIGSAVNLTNRLKNYYNISFLKREIVTNKSRIYRSLLKHGHSSFSLDILEYCEVSNLIKREQYYLDKLEPEYNILKVAGSLTGFKHSKEIIDAMRVRNTGRKHSESTILKLISLNKRAQKILVINNETNEKKELPSIRAGAKFIDLHHSSLAKSIKKYNKYVGKTYTIIKK